jgi:putative FmdB family regulatory protein
MSEVEVMAVYEFECKACGKHFEVSVPISEHDRLKKRPPKCPKCGKSRVQQLVSSFSTKAPSKY